MAKEQFSTELPFWDDFDGACWDELALDGMVLPGLWRIEADCDRDIDKKKSPGNDGAGLTDKGYDAAALVLHGELSTRAQWRDIQSVLRDLHPRKKGGATHPLQADHPGLAVMGIQTIFIKGIKAPEVENGRLQLRIAAYEWIKPVAKKGAAGATKGGYTSELPASSLALAGVMDPPAGLVDFAAGGPTIKQLQDDEFERLTNPNYKPSDSVAKTVPTADKVPPWKPARYVGGARVRE